MSDQKANNARQRTLSALDRLESELGGREYLVGDGFTVADLTAAALFYPLVLPPEGPLHLDPPAAAAELRESVADRPGYRWVEEMFARHRHKGAARTAAAQGTPAARASVPAA
jgi:glutathione S-transferase